MTSTKTNNQVFFQQMGEVPVHFVLPETLISLIPVALFSVIGIFIDRLLFSELPWMVHIVWGILIQGIVAGRFALASLSGKQHAEIFESFNRWSELPGFVLRFFILTSIWVTVLSVAILSSLPTEELERVGVVEWVIRNIYLTGSHPFNPGFQFFLILFSLTAILLLPLFSVLLTTLTHNPIHLFFPRFWIHLLKNPIRLFSVLVSYMGGLALPSFLYLPILGGGAILTFQISPTLGKLIAMTALTMPIISWPVLAGRLAGNYVRQHPMPREHLPELINNHEIVPPPVIRPTQAMFTLSAANHEGIPSPQPPIQVEEEVQRLEALFLQAPAQAILQLEKLRRAYAEEPQLLVLETDLRLKQGDLEQAFTLAPATLDWYQEQHLTTPAVELFLKFGKQRHMLNLSPAALDLLARGFMEQKNFKEAGWCAHTAEIQRSDPERAEKRLIQIADSASAAKDFVSASGLFKYYLAKHPNGPFQDYASKALDFNVSQSSKK